MFPGLSEFFARYWSRGNIDAFSYSGERPAGSGTTDVEELFWANEGTIVHKWHHYLPIYDTHFSKWRGKKVRMLEIGVSRGGSLALWRKYFGQDAVLFGIDINPGCAEFNGQSAQVRIGSQADPEFLKSVVEEMGGVDVILDDGSHVSKHIKASLDVLFPMLSSGGVYMIEDLHAAYWRGFGGGYRRPGSFIETTKTLIDDIHHWYHGQGQKIAATSGHLSAIHIYDSIVVLDKNAVARPQHTRRGKIE